MYYVKAQYLEGGIESAARALDSQLVEVITTDT